ncbi:MAG: GTPase HflX, partial [Bacteroidetes bacterium]
MIDKTTQIKEEERAVLVGLVHNGQTESHTYEYLDELAFLAETAGAKTIKRFWQKMPHPDRATFVGKGKLEEIGTFAKMKGATLLIFDDELTGSQINNITEATGIKT